jgi:hypothetical protein
VQLVPVDGSSLGHAHVALPASQTSTTATSGGAAASDRPVSSSVELQAAPRANSRQLETLFSSVKVMLLLCVCVGDLRSVVLAIFNSSTTDDGVCGGPQRETVATGTVSTVTVGARSPRTADVAAFGAWLAAKDMVPGESSQEQYAGLPTHLVGERHSESDVHLRRQRFTASQKPPGQSLSVLQRAVKYPCG